ncbi:hypothetical protein C8Q80DRAFT_656737 [Daedaleopsis nitida]|nr:hypothetical protein C8Q80DRAFT_656737 [Daedaleopsis nitida]
MPATLVPSEVPTPTFLHTTAAPSSPTTDTSVGSPLAFGTLDGTYGAYLLGTFFGLILYGLSLHQTHNYVRLFPTDTKLIQISVVVVMILETVHTAFTMHTIYFCLVTKFSDTVNLFVGVWSLDCIPLLMALNMFASQVFFARRVSLIGRRYQLIACLSMLFFLVEIGFALATVIQALRILNFWRLDEVNRLFAAIFTSAVMGDTLLTLSLFVVLRRSRRSAPRKEESVMQTLKIYIINTGLLHDVLNFVSLILAVSLNVNYFLHASVGIITTRLYANTLLLVLNSRKLSSTFDIQVFEGGNGMNVISRAKREAAQERWNVPQDPDECEMPVINIAVMTETASDKGYSRSL